MQWDWEEELAGAQSHSGSNGWLNISFFISPHPGKAEGKSLRAQRQPRPHTPPCLATERASSPEPPRGAEKIAPPQTPSTPERTCQRYNRAWHWNLGGHAGRESRLRPSPAPAQLRALPLVPAPNGSHRLLAGEAPRLPVHGETPGLERPGRVGHRVLQLLDDHEEQEEK